MVYMIDEFHSLIEKSDALSRVQGTRWQDCSIPQAKTRKEVARVDLSNVRLGIQIAFGKNCDTATCVLHLIDPNKLMHFKSYLHEYSSVGVIRLCKATRPDVPLAVFSSDSPERWVQQAEFVNLKRYMSAFRKT